VLQELKENLPPPEELAPTPTAEKDPKVTPVAVGGGVGSLTPEVVVTAENGYKALKACEKTLRPKNKKLIDSKCFIIIINFIGAIYKKIAGCELSYCYYLLYLD